MPFHPAAFLEKGKVFHHGVRGEPRRRTEKETLLYRASLIQARALSPWNKTMLRVPSWFSVISVVKTFRTPERTRRFRPATGPETAA